MWSTSVPKDKETRDMRPHPTKYADLGVVAGTRVVRLERGLDAVEPAVLCGNPSGVRQRMWSKAVHVDKFCHRYGVQVKKMGCFWARFIFIGRKPLNEPNESAIQEQVTCN